MAETLFGSEKVILDSIGRAAVQTGDTDNTLVEAVAGKKIRVMALHIHNTAAQTIRFESGAAGTALTGQMAVAANGSITLPYNPLGWFETAANTLLNLEASGGTAVAGVVIYILVGG